MAAKRQTTRSESNEVRGAREEAEVAAYNYLRDAVKDESLHATHRIRAAAVLVTVEPEQAGAKDS